MYIYYCFLKRVFIVPLGYIFFTLGYMVFCSFWACVIVPLKCMGFFGSFRAYVIVPLEHLIIVPLGYMFNVHENMVIVPLGHMYVVPL